jgi:glutathione S-transferase
MEQPLTLYLDAFGISPYGFAVFVCLTEKGLAFETTDIEVHERAQRTPEFEAKSVTGRVPVLERGGFGLSELSAIIEYLEEVHPAPTHPSSFPPALPASCPETGSCESLGIPETWWLGRTRVIDYQRAENAALLERPGQALASTDGRGTAPPGEAGQGARPEGVAGSGDPCDA